MQSIGERLEDARKKKGISIREAAEATKIRGEYLQKFEGNQFEIGLTDIYTRGFLRGYANFLRLPADRLLNDYGSIRGSEPRIRQPSREVYGRMDLGISTAEERSDSQADAPSSDGSQRQSAPRFPRPGESLPKGPPVDPTLVFKGGIAIVSIAVLLFLYWIVKSLVGPAPSPAPAREAARPASEISEASATAPAPVVSIVATQPVRVKVVRKSDGVELFQGQLQAGEHRDYPNVPIYLTASELGSVEIEYKGHRYSTGHTGWDRIQFDFSSR